MTIIYRYVQRIFQIISFQSFHVSDVFSVLIWLRLIASFQSVMLGRILRLRWLRAPLRWNWQRGKFENESNTQSRGCEICYCPSLRRYFHRNLCKVNKRKVNSTAKWFYRRRLRGPSPGLPFPPRPRQQHSNSCKHRQTECMSPVAIQVMPCDLILCRHHMYFKQNLGKGKPIALSSRPWAMDFCYPVS